MKRSILWAFALLLFLPTLTYAQEGESSKKLKGSERKRLEDFQKLRYALLNYTAEPYLYADSAALNKEFDSLESMMHRLMPVAERYRLYSYAVSRLRCGHTFITPRPSLYSSYLTQKCAPYMEVEYANDELHILDPWIYYKEASIGDEIVKINDQPVDEIVEKINTMLSSDGFSNTRTKKALRKYFWLYYYLYIGKKSQFVMKMKNADGEDYQLVCDAKKGYLFKDMRLESRGMRSENVAYPVLELNDENKYAYLKISTFFNKNEHRYRDLLFEHMKAIKNSGYQNIILDLRNNAGGRFDSYVFGVFADTLMDLVNFRMNLDPEIMEDRLFKKSSIFYKMHKFNVKQAKDMMSYGIDIQEFEKVRSIAITDDFRFKGNLVVLVNAYTFSAASLLASQLKYYCNATIIGEETGGSYLQGNSGNLKYVLPYSGFKLFVNPVYFKANVPEYQDHDGGVLPQIEVDEVFDYEKDKQDPYLKAALEYFESTSNNSSSDQ